jgi:hypothetical protein
MIGVPEQTGGGGGVWVGVGLGGTGVLVEVAMDGAEVLVAVGGLAVAAAVGDTVAAAAGDAVGGGDVAVTTWTMGVGVACGGLDTLQANVATTNKTTAISQLRSRVMCPPCV